VTQRLRRGEGKPDAFIYCTDGHGTFPARPPAYPVVWVATPGTRANFPWGQVIRLEEGKIG
jgi:predicted metal-dependent peptidase